MLSQQFVDNSESVILKTDEKTKPIWAFEIVLNWLKYLPMTLGIRFIYWGKSSET